MINLKKHDAVADAVKAIIQQEAITTDTLAGRVAGGKSNASKPYKVTAKGDGTDTAPESDKPEDTAARKSIKTEEVEQIDELKKSTVKSYLLKKHDKMYDNPAKDPKKARKDLDNLTGAHDRLVGNKPTSEEAVQEGWDDMLADVKKRNAPQPNGGAGKKQGTAYGGSKQKDKPEQDTDKTKNEETVQEGLGNAVKTLAKKTFKAFTGGSDSDHLKRLQKDMGLPQTGKPPAKQNESVDKDDGKSWSHEGDWHKSDPKKNPEGKVHNLAGQALKKTLGKFKSEKKK